MILEDLNADQLRELLAVYMAHVIDVESVDFLESHAYDIELTAEQSRQLRRASRTVQSMCIARDARLPWRQRTEPVREITPSPPICRVVATDCVEWSLTFPDDHPEIEALEDALRSESIYLFQIDDAPPFRCRVQNGQRQHGYAKYTLVKVTE